MRSFTTLLTFVLAAISVVKAAPASFGQESDLPEAHGKATNWLSDEVLEELAKHAESSKRAAEETEHVSETSSVSEAGNLSGLLGPLLALLQPMLSGVNIGLQAGASQTGKGVHQVGGGLSDAVSGVGSIVGQTAAGAGGTAKSLPAGLYHTLKNVEKHPEIVGQVVNMLTGSPSSSISKRSAKSENSFVRAKRWLKKL